MTLLELQNKNLKRGIFHKATWQSIRNVNGVEYAKVSNGVVRIVKYRNLKVVKAKLSEQAPMVATSNKQWLIEDLVYYNDKTHNMLVSLGTTHIKAKTKCYANGVEISRDEYDKIIKPTNSENTPIFCVKLENLLSIE